MSKLYKVLLGVLTALIAYWDLPLLRLPRRHPNQ